MKTFKNLAAVAACSMMLQVAAGQGNHVTTPKDAALSAIAIGAAAFAIGLPAYCAHRELQSWARWLQPQQEPALCKAIKQADTLAIARLLNQPHPNLDAVDLYYGETPLHLAVRFNNECIVQHLIDKGANVNSTAGHHTPLDIAQGQNDRRMAELLRTANAHTSRNAQ